MNWQATVNRLKGDGRIRTAAIVNHEQGTDVLVVLGGEARARSLEARKPRLAAAIRVAAAEFVVEAKAKAQKG